MQAQDRPRFRQDLVAEVVEAEGARFIDVGAPDSDNVFRFYEVEYAIACAMDGQRDVAGIVKWAQEELGVTPSAKEIQSVISTLTDLRFIGEDKGAVAADAKVAKAAPTQPEAKQPAADTELARGIVVGAQAAASAKAPVEDIALGASGSKAQPKAAEIPSGADFALGAPGAQAVAAPPKAPVEDIALGAPGAQAAAKGKAPVSEIGMDLSAHMGVGADDVKEAVRTSKAMAAVDVPKELLEAEAKQPAKAPEKQPDQSAKGGKGKSEADKKAQSERDKAAAAAKKAADAEKSAAAEKAEADKKAQSERDKAAAAEKKAAAAAAASEKKPVEQKADKQPEKAAEKKVDKKPAVELPKRATTDKPVAPPAPASGVSPILVVMLILVIVGAATFFVWKFVLSEPAQDKQVQAPPKPLPPPPPAVATSKLATETQAAQEIKAPAAGTIETIEPADKDVKAGDVIATLAGGKPLTNEITNLTKQIETAQPAIDAATKELEDAQQKPDNAAGVTAAQAKLDRLKKPYDEKKTKLETKKADLDKLSIKATTDGKLADVVKAGQKVAVDDKIAAIARPDLTVATFKVPAGTKMTPDGNLSVVAGDKTLVCTVIDAQAETVKVSCPADGVAAGTDVTFTLPK